MLRIDHFFIVIYVLKGYRSKKLQCNLFVPLVISGADGVTKDFFWSTICKPKVENCCGLFFRSNGNVLIVVLCKFDNYRVIICYQ